MMEFGYYSTCIRKFINNLINEAWEFLAGREY